MFYCKGWALWENVIQCDTMWHIVTQCDTLTHCDTLWHTVTQCVTMWHNVTPDQYTTRHSLSGVSWLSVRRIWVIVRRILWYLQTQDPEHYTMLQCCNMYKDMLVTRNFKYQVYSNKYYKRGEWTDSFCTCSYGRGWMNRSQGRCKLEMFNQSAVPHATIQPSRCLHKDTLWFQCSER